jgi:HD-like signal output (HDOD) protein
MPSEASLAELAPPALPQQTAELRAIENLLVSHFDGHDLSIPPLHNVAERVLPSLRGAKCDLVAAARTIAEDSVLAAAVLRTANSPLYRGVEEITSLPRAVTRLGANIVRTVIMHQSLRSALFDRRGQASQFADLLWRRSLTCATIMKGLAQFNRFDDDEAYLIGLLKDIGSVLVLRVLNSQEKSGFKNVDQQTFDYLCHECRQEFGELIADAWKLPTDVKALIADHRGHPTTDDPLRVQRLMLQLTEMIASKLAVYPEGDYDLLSGRAPTELGLIHQRAYQDWLTGLPAEIDDILDAA